MTVKKNKFIRFAEKHSKLIELAKVMTKTGFSNDKDRQHMEIPGGVPELLLWGEYYAHNDLCDAFKSAHEEYKGMCKRDQREDDFIEKHFELLELAKIIGRVGLSHDYECSNQDASNVPTKPGELLLWGKFYSGNALRNAYDQAWQEYQNVFESYKTHKMEDNKMTERDA